MRATTRPVRRPLAILFALVHAAITAAATIAAFLGSYAHPGVMTTSVLLVALLIWSLASWRILGRHLFDPYVLFLTSAFLFNAGQALLETANLNAGGMLGGEFADELLRRTLLVVAAGLAGLHTGALTALALRRPGAAIAHETEDQNWLRGVGWVSLAIAVPAATIWLSQSIAIVSASGYASLYDRDFSTGLSATPALLSSLLVTGTLFLTAGGRARRLEARFAGALVMTFVLIQFYMGYRSTAAMPLMAWAWLRHRAVRPIRGTVLLASAAVLLLVVFPVVKEMRNLSSLERSLGEVSVNLLSADNPAVISIDEMGQSMATVAHTVARLPSERPFDHGVGYAYAVLTLVPNLFWSVHPTIARGTNSDWLVSVVSPWVALHGGGYGYSAIAEAYLNFGIAGPPVVMALVGILLTTLVGWAERTPNAARYALVAVVLAFSLRFPRDELAGILRPIVWYGFLPYLTAVIGPAVIRIVLRTRGVTQPGTSLSPQLLKCE